MKNVVAQQAEPKAAGGSEVADAGDAGSASSTTTETASAPEDDGATTAFSCATSLNNELPFGIPKSNYSLHRPAVGEVLAEGRTLKIF